MRILSVIIVSFIVTLNKTDKYYGSIRYSTRKFDFLDRYKVKAYCNKN